MGSLLTRVGSEMPLGLTISRASQEQHILTIGRLLGKLVESESGTFGSMDALLSSCSELKSADLESFWHIKQPDIIGDSADNSDNTPVELGLALRSLRPIVGKMLDDARDGERVAVES